MARDALFRFAERIHPSFRTPSGALIFLGFLGALLALTGTYEDLYSLCVFAVWIFFALNAIARFVCEEKTPTCSSRTVPGATLDADGLRDRCDRPHSKLVDGAPYAFLVGAWQ
jgi:amino acid transporter